MVNSSCPFPLLLLLICVEGIIPSTGRPFEIKYKLCTVPQISKDVPRENNECFLFCICPFPIYQHPGFLKERTFFHLHVLGGTVKWVSLRSPQVTHTKLSRCFLSGVRILSRINETEKRWDSLILPMAPEQASSCMTRYYDLFPLVSFKVCSPFPINPRSF